MRSLLLILLLLFSSYACAQDTHILPRPLILEYPDGNNNGTDHDHHDQGRENGVEEVVQKTNCNDHGHGDQEMVCTSWRFAVEANNLSPWKTIPEECIEYVKSYMTGKGYKSDLERVAYESNVFAKSVSVGVDGKDVWVFDVDETLISNLPYYADHSFGMEVFDPLEFDKWVEKGVAPAIESSLRLYEEVMGLGFKVFLLTGRKERHREITVQNLMDVGFKNWDKLILRSDDDHGKSATGYKSEKRDDMVKEGFRILGNSGDQWSDLLGSSISARSFKLPNPMYYIL